MANVMKIDLKVAHFPLVITHFYLHMKNQKLQEEEKKGKNILCVGIISWHNFLTSLLLKDNKIYLCLFYTKG